MRMADIQRTCAHPECTKRIRPNNKTGYCRPHIPHEKFPCAFRECGRIAIAKGLCSGHWQQESAGKELTPLSMRALTFMERYEQKIQKTDACWNWTGSKVPTGYGYIRENGKMRRAHRVAYALANGKIPEGMEVDHMCHNRSCVNSSHLRLVTRKQNNENLSGPPKTNKSGIRGVRKDATGKKWIARVRHNNIDIHVGTFEYKAEAEAAVVAKRNELFTHNDLDRI